MTGKRNVESPCCTASVSPRNRTRCNSQRIVPSLRVSCQRSPCCALTGPASSSRITATHRALTVPRPSPASPPQRPSSGFSSWDAFCRTCYGRSCRGGCEGRLWPWEDPQSSVVNGRSLHAAQLQETLVLIGRHGHHREASHAHEPQVGERPVLLNLGERHRSRQSPHGAEIHHSQLGVLLLGVGIGCGRHFRHAHHGLLVSSVIDQNPVAGFHLAQMLQGQIVLDAVPDGGLLSGEVVVAVGGRLCFDNPVAAHSAPWAAVAGPPAPRQKYAVAPRGARRPCSVKNRWGPPEATVSFCRAGRPPAIRHRIPLVQATIASESSPITSASVLPDRLST